MKNVLIVDDEEKIREVIVSYLNKEGYHTREAATGTEALEILRSEPVHLIILDLMLPDLPGEEICQQIRRFSAVPILMLTAKSAEDERIQGLLMGADDYVVKPFSPREVVARVKAILRRSEQDLLAERLAFGELLIDTGQRKVFRHGQMVNLTPMEYKLLLILARHPHRAFSREELIEKLFGFDYEGDLRTIDQHVKNLRHKIEPIPSDPMYIQTVYGFGYRFVGDDTR